MFKRDDRVRIISGLYQGHRGVVEVPHAYYRKSILVYISAIKTFAIVLEHEVTKEG